MLTHGLGQADAALQWLGATHDGQCEEGNSIGAGAGAEHSPGDAAPSGHQGAGPSGMEVGAEGEGEGKGGGGVCSCVLGPGGVRRLLPGDEHSVRLLRQELTELVDGMQRVAADAAAAAAAAAAGVGRTRPSAPTAAAAAQGQGQAAAGPKTQSKAAATLSTHGFPALPSDDLRHSMDQAATASAHASTYGKPALTHANGSHPAYHGPGGHASTPATSRSSFPTAASQARSSSSSSSSNAVLAALLAWLPAVHAALRALASAVTRGLSTAQAWVVCRAAAAWVKVKEAVGRLRTSRVGGGWPGQAERLATAAVLGMLLLAALRAEAPHVRVHVGSQAAWLWEAAKDALRMGTALHPSPVAVP